MSEFFPTVAFGFYLIRGKTELHQMFVSAEGKVEWRPVPMIDLDRPETVRQPAVAGFVSEDADGA